jgi:hypothetical protein
LFLYCACEHLGDDGADRSKAERVFTGPIEVTVHDLLPGTSNWNKIEHRLDLFITM